MLREHTAHTTSSTSGHQLAGITSKKFKKNNIYKDLVREVQEEFVRQAIHQDKTVKDVVKYINSQPACSIAFGTVKRLFHFGKDSKHSGYTLGPYSTTLFMVADALDFEIVARPRSKNGSGNGRKR